MESTRLAKTLLDHLRHSLALTAAISLALQPACAYALPAGGVISGGSATIATSGNTTTITQSTGRAIIDWNSFDVGSSESVHFAQPNAGSITFNRIHDSKASLIDGSITANGNVWFSNANGMVFGHNASVNVGGLLATTANITDANFMAGNYVFDIPGSAGASIINHGQLTVADGGLLALVAPRAQNAGYLTARVGKIQLGSGDTFTIDPYGDGLINLQASPALTHQLLENTGTLSATGGSIALTMAAAQDTLSSLINLEGMAAADSIDISGKTVSITGALTAANALSIAAHNIAQQGTLDAWDAHFLFDGAYIDNESSSVTAHTIHVDGSGGANSSIFASGTYDASSANGAGGDITMEASRSVKLYGAHLDASGDTGGTIKVGGDWQGAAGTQTAKETVVSGASTLKADGASGDGGTVVVWSDDNTRFAGSATAKSVHGDGGAIEISSKDTLQLSQAARIDASSVWGQAGSVLFDPKNITISNSAADPTGVSYFELVDPNPDGNVFGSTMITLANGNVVVGDYSDDFAASDAGAVYLFNGATGALISTIRGSTANDEIGWLSLTALSNGNYVIGSRYWSNGIIANAGAVTWCSGSTGCSGSVSTANSIYGTHTLDQVGYTVTALSNGNYVASTFRWNDMGAATWINGTNGHTVNGNLGEAVDATNSLVGTTSNDQTGHTVTALTNGNYLVLSYSWDNGGTTDVGAVTWGNGATGTVGPVTTANSLYGTTTGDIVGTQGMLALSNGNYVIFSPYWDNGGLADAGAATWGNGATGTSGAVSTANSLYGSKANDFVGLNRGTALTNGNYVVSSTFWSDGVNPLVGAATWINGSNGHSVNGNLGEAVGITNSLIGATVLDFVGFGGIIALSNGNYVVGSPSWDNGADGDTGAATLGNGTSGTVGLVSTANSLYGTTAGDQVGYQLTALTNGNYAVNSYMWDNGAVTDAGAVTWVNGTTGLVGAVSTGNSLYGTQAGDSIGLNGVTALTNGNYVVSSSSWDNAAVTDAGAVTWINGANGRTLNGNTGEAVGTTNSLYGTANGDTVGLGGSVALGNGNYVAVSTDWDNGAVSNAGSVTLGNGASGTAGAITSSNSLVGHHANDQVGSNGVFTLSNGNYVVLSGNWNYGTLNDAGAATLCSGTAGCLGQLNATNSIVGTVANSGLDTRILTDTVNNRWTVAFANAEKVYSASSSLATVSPNSLTFAYDALSDYFITPGFLTNILNAGSNVTLQANNDITVNDDITVNNASGDGGDLIMQAGRSILLNANITTDNGDLTLYANEKLAAGVVDAQRDAGASAITMAAGTTINAGTGTVTLRLDDGAGKTNATGGNITLRDIVAGVLSITNNAGGILSGGAATATTSAAGGTTMFTTTDINFAHDYDITAASTGTVTLRANNSILSTGSGDITTASGAITLNSDRDASGAGAIALGSGTALTSTGGSITLGGGATPASVAAYGTAANVHGVYLDNATLDAGGGNISVRGTGYAGVTNWISGITMTGGLMQTNGNGTITLTGQSIGGGASSNNIGFQLTPDGVISVQNGALTINGTGGTGTGGGNYGVRLTGSNVSSPTVRTTGTGTITINGTGGNSGAAGSGFNYGIINDGNIQSTAVGGGTITLNGVSGDQGLTTDYNLGIALYNGSPGIVSLDGNITLNATGAGTNGYDYWIYGGEVTTTGAANITATANSGGMIVLNNGIIRTTGSGNITLNTDTITLNNTNALVSAGDLTLRTQTLAQTIGIGGSAGTLQITQGIFDNISAANLIIGRSTGTGLMRVGTADLSARNYHLALLNGSGNIQLDGDITMAANKNFSTAATTGSVSTTTDVDIATSGTGSITIDDTLTLGGDFTAITANGTIAISGAVNSANATRRDVSLTSTGGSITLGGAWGGLNTLGDVSIQALGGLTLPSIIASSVFARTTGATADITLTGTLSADDAADAIVIASGDDFINNAGAGVMNLTGGGRWLVYSETPPQNTYGSLIADFALFNTTFAGNPPGSIMDPGDGFLYSSAFIEGGLGGSVSAPAGGAGINAMLMQLINGGGIYSAFRGSLQLDVAQPLYVMQYNDLSPFYGVPGPLNSVPDTQWQIQYGPDADLTLLAPALTLGDDGIVLQ